MVKIITDSSCDLTRKILNRYNVSVVPLQITCGDMTYKDGVDITPKMIFQWAEENKSIPKTSAPSLVDVVSVIRPYVENGTEVVCVTISGELSTTRNVFNLIADELNEHEGKGKKKVHVVDSMSLSAGQGLLVIKAAILAKQGLSATEIVKELEAQRDNLSVSFIVDNLNFLYHGGRCSGLELNVGKVLHIRPRILVKNGKLSQIRKYRGSMEQTIWAYTKDIENELENVDLDTDRCVLIHSDCDPELVKATRMLLIEMGIFKEIVETEAGGLIASHCGPGALGIMYMRKNLI